MLALLLSSAVAVAGCGGDDDSPTSPSGVTVGVSGVIANNHGHTAAVSAAQISAGSASAGTFAAARITAICSS
jgi:hypothetical protein